MDLKATQQAQSTGYGTYSDLHGRRKVGGEEDELQLPGWNDWVKSP